MLSKHSTRRNVAHPALPSSQVGLELVSSSLSLVVGITMPVPLEPGVRDKFDLLMPRISHLISQWPNYALCFSFKTFFFNGIVLAVFLITDKSLRKGLIESWLEGTVHQGGRTWQEELLQLWQLALRGGSWHSACFFLIYSFIRLFTCLFVFVTESPTKLAP